MRGTLLSAALWLVLLHANGMAEAVGMKGKVEGESFAHLRSGPDLSYPSKAILRRGEELTLEKEEGGWYLVALVDGRRGYIHKSLVAVVKNGGEKSPAKNGTAQLPAQGEALSEPRAEGKNDLSPASPQPARPEAKARPLPLIRLLEGREMEILWWLGVALCIFIIGWICGGNYYLRRDRIRRTKLRF